jgi:uncharacterized protein YdeI (BOF family)
MEAIKEEPLQRGSSFIACRCGRAAGIPGSYSFSFFCMPQWKFFSNWLVGCCLYSLLCLTPAQAQTPSTIFISEVAWAGSSLSASDEWIELANPTSEAIDISGWQLTGAASSGMILTLPEGSIIAPQTTFLIANYNTEHENASFAITPSYVTSSISLSNSALQITLTNAQGEAMDVAGNGAVPFAGTSGGTSAGGVYASMQRLSPASDGSLAESWTTTTTQTGIKDGLLDLATPGAFLFENMTEETPVAQTETVVEEEIQITETTSVTEETDALTETAIEEVSLGQEISSPSEEQTIESETPQTSVSLETEEDSVPESTETSEPSVAETADDSVIMTEEISSTLEETTENTVAESAQENTSTQTDTPSQEEQASQAFSSYQQGDLLINEFISHPMEGEEEWVEFHLPGTEKVLLAGWTLEDATGKQTALGDTTITGGSYLLVASPKGILNNDGDTLILKDGTGNVIDTLVYGTPEIPAPEKGIALAKTIAGIWHETTTATPGSENIFSVMLEESANEAPSSSPATEEQTVKGSQEETPASLSYDYASLRLSEIYPNTKGSDEAEEFIEIENIGEKTVDLFGVILEDASGKQYIFPDHQLLANVALFSVPRLVSGIALNNLKETVFLYDPSYQLLDQVSYEKSTQGQSLARISGSWSWTTHLTQNEPNAFPNTQMDDPSTTPTTDIILSSATTTTTSVSVDRAHTASRYSLKTLAQAQDLSDDTQVRVTGVVNTTPGTLGKQIFYLQDETGGLQIYQYRSDFPDLQEGDMITVQGTMSTNRGERRLKIGGKEDITLVQTSSPLIAQEFALSEVSEEYAGALVSISGIVVSKENASIVLEEEGVQMTVRLASSTGLTTGDFPTGAHMTITGILTKNDNTLTLLPRSVEDIQIVSQTTDEPLVSGLSAQEQTSRRIALALTLMACAALAGFALFHYAPRITSYVTRRPVRIGA